MSWKRSSWSVLVGAAGLVSVVAAWGGAHQSQEQKGQAPVGWVCPPCGCETDEEVRASTGNCSSCGMGLVDAASVPVVAILLFEGVDLFSAAAPASVFENTARVLTVADTDDPIATRSLGEIVPETTFAELPRCDVLILPSGYGTLAAANDALVAGWVKRAVSGARHVIPVGLGGVILAKCGGEKPLTLPFSAHSAEHVGAENLAGATVDTTNAVVDQGKVVAARDGTAAVLAACRVLERVSGRETAQRVADELGVVLEAGAAR
jgi:cyclohexyl-isocyanide hydratase